MSRLQCEYCKRFLATTPEVIKYYETAKHPVMCGQCVKEAERSGKGHTFICRTPEYISIVRM